MEYAMMVTMGAVSQDTVVITTVHDCQVVDIPDELTDEHDLTVKYQSIERFRTITSQENSCILLRPPKGAVLSKYYGLFLLKFWKQIF